MPIYAPQLAPPASGWSGRAALVSPECAKVCQPSTPAGPTLSFRATVDVKERLMLRWLRFGVLLVAAWVTVNSLPDISRYLKMRAM